MGGRRPAAPSRRVRTAIAALVLAGLAVPIGLGVSGPTSARPSAPAVGLGLLSGPASGHGPVATLPLPGALGRVAGRAEFPPRAAAGVVGFRVGDPLNQSAVFRAFRTASEAPGGAAGGPGAPGPVTERTTLVEPDRPRSAGASGLATFVGYVNDTTDRKGIANVTVLESTVGVCGVSNCLGGVTDASGRFTMNCTAPGGITNDYTLSVNLQAWYMNNYSYAVCSPGNATYVGTMFLVRDGSAYGTVEEAGTGTPVPNVSVTSIARDASTTADPTATTNSRGMFDLAVPAEPSRVLFGPPAGYLPTFNYTNATPGTGTRPGAPPWGSGVNMGTIYLTRETLVRAVLYDTSTGRPIGPGVLASITACDARTGNCRAPGPSSLGPNATGFAEPGPTYLNVYAQGYAEATSATVTVPEEVPGTAFLVRPVWVTPYGSVAIEPRLFEPTGGTQPFNVSGPTSGAVQTVVCSLDGYDFSVLQITNNFTGFDCVGGPCELPLDAPRNISGTPLRDIVYLDPGCGASAGSQVPLFATRVELNLTPGYELAGVIDSNLSIGDYVAGTVLDASNGTAPVGCFTVAASSTDVGTLASSAGWNSCAPDPVAAFAPCKALMAYSAAAFCAAVPPGNSELKVQDPSYESNWTWVAVPSYCCRTAPGGAGYPASLSAATADHVTSINLSLASGNVSGWVVAAGPPGGPAVTPFYVTACAQFPSTATPCSSTESFGDEFNLTDAPVGVDLVEAGSPGYAPDSVWVNVSSAGSVDAGTIPLSPLGTVAGEVVDPNGNGVYLATVGYCTLANATSCVTGGGASLGTGYSGTDGGFNGTVPGGWLPGATYVIEATAPGYTTNWEFVNVSAGGFVTLPPLTIYPAGTNYSRPDRPRVSTAPALVWVTGRVVDSITGAGVNLGAAGAIAACPVGASYLCGGFPDGVNSEGFFNGSVTPGLYYLNVSSAGYRPASVYLNATGTGYVNVGEIVLQGDEWLSGRVVIAPWTGLTLGTAPTVGTGFAPPAGIVGCNATGGRCQWPMTTSANGTFNVTVPPGAQAELTVLAPIGFSANDTREGLTGSFTHLNGSGSLIPLLIYGVLSGRVLDADSTGAATEAGVGSLGLFDASVTVVARGWNPGTTSITADADGAWTAFVPGGNGPGTTIVTADASPGFDSVGTNLSYTVPNGASPTAPVNLSLDHEGWLVGRFVTSGTAEPLPDATVTTNAYDPATRSVVNLTTLTNLAGVANDSAAPRTNDTVSVTGTFANRTVFDLPTVTGDATAFLGGSGYTGLRGESVESDGFVLSSNTTFSPGGPPLGVLPTPVVRDAVNGRPLAGADITVQSIDPNLPASVPESTNAAGEFYANAIPGPHDGVWVSAPGYGINHTGRYVAPGSYTKFSSIDLTGDAVIAGTITAVSNDTPIPGASITLCAPVTVGSGCTTTTSNLSGVFWATEVPGHTIVSVNASGFVQNVSSVRTCSDCWVSMGTVWMDPEGGATGTVIGLPSGTPLAGANVSLCPQDLYEGRPCGLGEETNARGQFYLVAPPGDWELTADAPGYNLTALEIEISEGQIVNVGRVDLEEFGNLTGSVLSTTDVPIANASVVACGDYTGGTCLGTVVTTAAGLYALSAPPGPEQLTVSAQGYDTGYALVEVVAATLTTAGPVYLTPIGGNTPVQLSGVVVEAIDPSVGVDGASVAAEVNRTVEYSVLTTANGSFDLPVFFGTYTVVAADTAGGYAPSQQVVDVTASVSGLRFELASQTFVVHGTVVDAFTHDPIPGVRIDGPVPSNGSEVGLPVLGVTGSDGEFNISLSNGGATLVAEAPPGASVPYAATLISVVVNNGGRSLGVIDLAPARSAVRITVVDAGTGLPVPGATVGLTGAPEPGFPTNLSLITGPDGSATTTTYYADYDVQVSAAGYAGARSSEVVRTPDANVTIELSRVAPGTAPGPANAPPWVVLLGGLLGAVAIVLVAGLIVRRRASTPLPPGPEEGPQDRSSMGDRSEDAGFDDPGPPGDPP